MMKIKVRNETAKLKAVVVGIANDFGGTPKVDECYDPKSRAHVKAGTYPTIAACVKEMDALVTVFKKYNIKVYRPQNIKGLNQIFSRDIAFAIEDKLVIPNIIEDRKEEADAIVDVLTQIDEEDIIKMPVIARAEGGDVMPWNEYIFVGYSEKEDFEHYTVARTNKAGVDFLATSFPNKIVKGFELNKSDDDPRENALHLDCCFQPIGENMAIMYKGGFKHTADVEFLVNYFGEQNIIEVNKEEMYNMNSNVFSISEEVIVSEKGFTRLNIELRKRGFKVEEVPYTEIAKMEGLLRCSTMPLIRQ
ncbi:MAG: amidinotransferase [Flavobacteriales bacterium]|jgi:N-dimethylarginine dimethylaminohydrolase|nr:amidinotransferase [Flavobacteriales bacterium]MDG1348697.1 arginine deiminase family protein [Flavobacteriales bacterium]|tara:strand:- start:10 stop:924 length:915 start_codon:yes stop_codon:yes gene_type:complete